MLTNDQIIKNFKAVNERNKRWDAIHEELVSKDRVQDLKIQQLDDQIRILIDINQTLCRRLGHGPTS